MNAPQINRHRTADLSPKEVLRAHIEQLSLDMQREFVAIALQLIAARPTPCEVDLPAYQPIVARKFSVRH
jgi:hypothetical protein